MKRFTTSLLCPLGLLTPYLAAADEYLLQGIAPITYVDDDGHRHIHVFSEDGNYDLVENLLPLLLPGGRRVVDGLHRRGDGGGVFDDHDVLLVLRDRGQRSS